MQRGRGRKEKTVSFSPYFSLGVLSQRKCTEIRNGSLPEKPAIPCLELDPKSESQVSTSGICLIYGGQ